MVSRHSWLVGLGSIVLLVGAVSALATWYFWPLLYEPEPQPPARTWAPEVTVLAGTGADGHRDTLTVSASFSEPFGVVLRPDGTLVVADAGSSNAIREVTQDGIVRTIAGGSPGFRDGSGKTAQFDTPSALAIDSGSTLLVADTGNHAIRRVALDGSVSTIAGSGGAGFLDGPASAAKFDAPVGLAVRPDGTILVADSCNDRIRRITPTGRVETFAGDGLPGLVDGPSTSARFDTPTGLVLTADGTLLVADTGNDAIRRITPDGSVSTLRLVDAAGLPFFPARPLALTAFPDGRLYVADRRGIIEVATDGTTRLLAGSSPGFADGTGNEVRFRTPSSVAASSDWSLVVADSGNRMIRLLRPPGARTLAPPSSPLVSPGFDLGTFASLPILWPLDPQSGPHEVAGTVGEARGNPGGEGRERFHAGIDVRGDEGEPVLAVRDGVVEQVIATGNFGTLNEYLTIGPMTYVHIRVGRDRRDRPLDTGLSVEQDAAGKAVRVRVPRGWRVHTGEVIGTVNRFRHVHLSIGPAGAEANALDVGLPNFLDTVPPVIAPKGIEMTDVDGHRLTERLHGRLAIRRPVRIVVEAWDRVNGDAPSRRLGVYRLGYQVLTPEGEPLPGFESPRVTISFDRLPPDPDAPHAIYAAGSGIPFYRRGRTRFRYNITTRLESDHVVDAPWDPSTLPRGDYILRLLVADEAGNVALEGRDVAITLP